MLLLNTINKLYKDTQTTVDSIRNKVFFFRLQQKVEDGNREEVEEEEVVINTVSPEKQGTVRRKAADSLSRLERSTVDRADLSSKQGTLRMLNWHQIYPWIGLGGILSLLSAKVSLFRRLCRPKLSLASYRVTKAGSPEMHWFYGAHMKCWRFLIRSRLPNTKARRYPSWSGACRKARLI
jgi:hypothetical protein